MVLQTQKSLYKLNSRQIRGKQSVHANKKKTISAFRPEMSLQQKEN